MPRIAPIASPLLPRTTVELSAPKKAEVAQPRVERTGAGLPQVPAEPLENFNGLTTWKPRHAFRPRSIDELCEVMKWVSTQPKSLKVKAGGSRHSVTGPATDGVYIHPEGLAFTQDLGGGMFRVGSGTKVRALNQKLWDAGYALPVLGGYDGQTIGGVLPTGTHGSQLQNGPLFSLVRSMDLVTADGRKLRIEPKDGPTDIAPAGMELVKSDDTFHAALQTVGTFGVVHSYVLASVPKFHMRETRTLSTTEQIKAVLSGGNVYNRVASDKPEWVPADDGRNFPGQPEKTYHTEIAFNPHSGLAVVTGREKVKIDIEPHDMSGRPARDLCLASRLDKKYTRPVFTTWFQEHLHGVLGFVTDLASRVFPKADSKITDGALKTMIDKDYIGRSYNVFHLGDGSSQIPARFGSFFVPLRGDMYLKAMDVLQDAAKEWAAKHKSHQTGPISMRFVKASEATMSFPEDVCSFEIIFGGHQKHAEAMLGHYRQALEKAFGKDVYYHFGQSLGDGITAKDIAERYPRLPEWNAIRAQLDPDGRFVNAQQEQLGLGAPAESEPMRYTG